MTNSKDVKKALDSDSDNILAYYDLDEIYKYPDPIEPIDSRQSRRSGKPFLKESNMKTKEERVSYRKDRLPQRIYKKITQINNKDNLSVIRRGILLEFNSEASLNILKTGLTFLDSKGNEKCFLHEIEGATSEIPSDISKIFKQYSEVVEKNKELEMELQSKVGKEISQEDIEINEVI